MLGRARIIMLLLLLLLVTFVCGAAAAGALSAGDVGSLAGSGTEEFPGDEFDTSATAAYVLWCGLFFFWRSFGAGGSGGGGGAGPAATTGTMVTISTVLSLVIIAFRRRCWRSRTSGAAAEHRRKRRRVPKKNKKAAVTALVVLFLAGAADRRSTLVAEAATLPTEFGSVNIARVTIALTGNAYTGTIPSQLGYMVDVTSMNMWQNKFASSIPTEMGLMTGVASEFNLYSNDLCGAIPTEVAALSSQVATWDITTDTFVGPTPCPAVSALVALYEGTAGTAWTAKNGWMGSSSGPGDPCTTGWYGLSCSSSAGSVVGLDAASNGLSGTLPSRKQSLAACDPAPRISAHADALTTNARPQSPQNSETLLP